MKHSKKQAKQERYYEDRLPIDWEEERKPQTDCHFRERLLQIATVAAFALAGIALAVLAMRVL